MTTLLARPSDYAALLGVDYDPTDVATLTVLEAASDLARSYCNRTFDLVVDDEITVDGSGTPSLILPEAPLWNITEATVTCPGEIATELDMADVRASRAGIVYLIDGALGWWTRGYANVAITYSHGYLLPGTEPPVDFTPDPLPADLQMAVCQLAARLVASPSGQAIESESIGTYAVAYSNVVTMTAEMPETKTLDRYRLPHR